MHCKSRVVQYSETPEQNIRAIDKYKEAGCVKFNLDTGARMSLHLAHSKLEQKRHRLHHSIWRAYSRLRRRAIEVHR